MKARCTILFLRGISFLPLWAIHFIAFVMGNLIYLFPTSIKKTCSTNLKLCFPEYNSNTYKHHLRKTLIESCKTLLEFGYIWFRDPATFLRKIVSIEGEELLRQEFNKGKGVILAAPHLGQWELLGLHLSKTLPCCFLYRPPNIQQLEEVMVKARARSGAKIVPANTAGIRKLFQSLKNGELLGILPDQDPASGDGVFAPFFGVQAKTMVLLSRFAAKTKTPVFVSYTERLPFARGFKIHFKKVDAGIYSKDLLESVTTLNHAIEGIIKQSPFQYQWTYKRFKSRPEGEDKVY